MYILVCGGGMWVDSTLWRGALWYTPPQTLIYQSLTNLIPNFLLQAIMRRITILNYLFTGGSVQLEHHNISEYM